jgi:hypothetical protein
MDRPVSSLAACEKIGSARMRWISKPLIALTSTTTIAAENNIGNY